MISTLKEKIIKSINISRALGIAVLAIFFSLVFSDKISNWVINQVHYIPVTIISSEWATDNSDKGRFICDANVMGTIISNNGFEIVPEDGGQVVFYPLYENADISFEMPAYPNVHITFETGLEDGIFVFLKDGKYIRSIGEYEREAHSINYFFFSFSELFYIYLW
ncbi:MAG: hypothetical protein K2H85_10735, partial [Allobaculum sp.]|nr:hypothetical protein [Allobaculum sp.]